MIPRKTSFAVGLLVVGLGAYAVLGQDEKQMICHPGFAAAGRPARGPEQAPRAGPEARRGALLYKSRGIRCSVKSRGE